MTDIPVRFPLDPYCRALSRIMLTVDENTGELYIGVTPDGVSFGRDMLSKITAWAGDEQLEYTCAVKDNTVVLETAKGCAAFAISRPNMLVIEGKGISLMIGNGKTAGIFMGGGSAVDDAAEGALYVTSGVRLRVISRGGSVEVRSAWDLDALSDPDPRVFMHPGTDGTLGAVVFETDFDVPFSDDGVTVKEAAADMAAEFEEFLKTLAEMPESEEALHAAYIVWTTLQPARVLNQQRITGPEYVSNRRDLGTAMLYDNVLLSAFLGDSAAAAERMCSFLKYMQADGLVPRQANNRMFLTEAEAPMFGVVLKTRPDVCAAVSEEQYETLKCALGWWREERFCSERELYYYLHRYEPGCGKKLPFADNAPEFAPDLNAYMIIWLDAMADIADRLGRGDDASEYRALSDVVSKNMKTRLWRDRGYVFTDITDREACSGHPAACAAVLAADRIGASETAGCELPSVYALPLLIAAADEIRKPIAGVVLKTAGERGIKDLRQALALLAADCVVKGGE